MFIESTSQPAEIPGMLVEKQTFKQSVPSTMKRIHNKPFKSFQILCITQMGVWECRFFFPQLLGTNLKNN